MSTKETMYWIGEWDEKGSGFPLHCREDDPIHGALAYFPYKVDAQHICDKLNLIASQPAEQPRDEVVNFILDSVPVQIHGDRKSLNRVMERIDKTFDHSGNFVQPKPEQAVGDGVIYQRRHSANFEFPHFEDCTKEEYEQYKAWGHHTRIVYTTPRPAVATPVNPYERAVIEQAMVTECVSIDGRDPADVIRDIISWHVSMNSVATPAEQVVGDGVVQDIRARVRCDSETEWFVQLVHQGHTVRTFNTFPTKDGAEKYLEGVRLWLGRADAPYATPRPAVATPAEVTDEHECEYENGDGACPACRDLAQKRKAEALTAQCQVRKDGGVADRFIVAARTCASRLQILCDTRLRGVECADARAEYQALNDAIRAVLASPSAGAAVPEGKLDAQLDVSARKLLRAVVDKAWQEATESEQVPATEWADRIIDNVLAAAPEVPWHG